jgi:thiosulfate reductase cytochrome b subunit
MAKPSKTYVWVHPPAVRIMHWINAAAMLLMIGSGWHIYNNDPIVSWISFPRWAVLGGDPELTYKLNKDVGFGNALLWHFAFMWVFVINGAVALIYGLATRRIQRKWFPITAAAVWRDLTAALTFRLNHDNLSVYNAVQKLSYIGVVLAMLLVFASGLAIWKPVQFQWLTALFYDFQGARFAHFLAMMAIVLFLAVHVTLAVLVPRSLLAMITGKVRAKRSDVGVMPAAGE